MESKTASPAQASAPELRAPHLDEIKLTAARIAEGAVATPVHAWRGPQLDTLRPKGAEMILKLELLQRTGTFKARAALNCALALDAGQIVRGVTTISAGNHAVGVAYAAAVVGASAKVVMMDVASPARIEAARRYNAEVTLVSRPEDGFAMVKRMEEEGRTYIPSFPNIRVACGTGTLGLELFEQIPDIDAVVVPIGGGGLISGVSACLKQLNPLIKVYGVEPTGAGVVSRSVRAGEPLPMPHPDTIADSLAPPMTNAYAVAQVTRFVDEIVSVTDDQMAAAAALLFSDAKLCVEPAGASTTAAVLGPLKAKLVGQRVVPIVCGSNIDPAAFCAFLDRGVRALDAGVLSHG